MPYSQALNRAVNKYRNKNEEIHNKIKLKNKEYTKISRAKWYEYRIEAKRLLTINID